MDTRLYHLHLLTALHVGGGEGGGVIDRPFAREAATGLPVVPGSGIKGVWRDELGDQDKELNCARFGPESAQAETDRHEGALHVGDARLLCLPVRAWRGLFVWATCPLILHRYRNDLRQVGIPDRPEEAPPQPGHLKTALVTGGTAAWKNVLYLNDLDLAADATNALVKKWAVFIAGQAFPESDDAFWQEAFCQRFVIVDDMIFDYLAETATEIRPRVALEQNSRTVKEGGLSYEECLPAESLLWGVIAVGRNRRPGSRFGPEDLKLPDRERLQIGGNATVGYGQTRWMLSS